MNNRQLKDRFSGCILGLALGDALGAPFEGKSIIDINALSDLIEHPKYTLNYTDDTEMTIGIAEALIDGFSSEALVRRFIVNFNKSRGYGRGTRNIIKLLEQGTPWQTANTAVFAEGSFGNGAAMRVAPMGLMYYDNNEKLIDSVYQSCIVTHTHPLAIEGAAIIAKATAMAINCEETSEILEKVRDILKKPEYIRKVDAIRELLITPPSPHEAAKKLGNSVKADMSVPAALLAFLLFGSDYTGAVRYAIEMGGDTDTIAGMTGAMAGALTGVGGLPQTPLSFLEGKSRLESIAGTLYDITIEAH